MEIIKDYLHQFQDPGFKWKISHDDKGRSRNEWKCWNQEWYPFKNPLFRTNFAFFLKILNSSSSFSKEEDSELVLCRLWLDEALNLRKFSCRYISPSQSCYLWWFCLIIRLRSFPTYSVRIDTWLYNLNMVWNVGENTFLLISSDFLYSYMYFASITPYIFSSRSFSRRNLSLLVRLNKIQVTQNVLTQSSSVLMSFWEDFDEVFRYILR